MSRVAKIVVAKSAFKRYHSTRTLAKKLTAEKHPGSKSAIHHYLKSCPQLKLLKLNLQPSLAEDQRRRLLEFVKARKNWSVQDWRRIIFSDDSPFEILPAPIRQNDGVWARSSSHVPVVETVKQPLKILVWGLIS